MRKSFKVVLLQIAAGTLLAQPCIGQDKDLSNWPAGTSPNEIGKRVAERFVSAPHTNFGQPGAPQYITYPEAVPWYGALTFAHLTAHQNLSTRPLHQFHL